MRTLVERAWPKERPKERPKEIPTEMPKVIEIPNVEVPVEVKAEPAQNMIVSVDSKDLASQISPILSDKFFLIVVILCGTCVFCALLCLCTAMSMSATIRRLELRLNA